VKHFLSCALCLLAPALWAIAETPNVLLLSIDTIRADRFGCYGYPLETTPNLDFFANSALLFEDAICEIPLTSPSFASMLSGHFPRTTGTTRNGLRMPTHVPLVAEQFQNAGYYTFCVQSNWTLKDKLSGLGRGFDHYDDAFHKKRWGFMKAERDGDDVTRLALELLANRDPAKPFFGWIHYSDPHAPYKMHKKFNPSGKRAWGLGNVEKVRTKYDSEVAFTDSELQKVLDVLPENTQVLIVGDHGESLYEHDYLGHGRRIHQTNMHIPLIIRAEGLAPGRSKAPARGIDIGPTLLGLAELPKPTNMGGFDLLQDDVPAERTRVIETYGGAVPNLPGVKRAMADAGPMRQGVLREGWKLILSGGKTELFFLPDDPGELRDRSAEEPNRTEWLSKLVQGWVQATPQGEQGTEDLNAEDWKALESLGYLE
jgi:choline-sulfatase